MMDQDQRLLLVGLYINSALYIAGCFIAGLLTNHPVAWRFAILTAGIAYFGYFSECWRLAPGLRLFLTTLSIFAGMLAGLSLLW